MRVTGLNLEDALHFPQDFLHLLVVKLRIGCEQILEVEEWYEPPLSLCRD